MADVAVAWQRLLGAVFLDCQMGDDVPNIN